MVKIKFKYDDFIQNDDGSEHFGDESITIL